MSSEASAARKPHDGGRTPWVFVAFGLVSIGLLVSNDAVNRRSIVRDTARMEAVAKIERDAAVSHLWLEEYVSGDEVDTHELVHGLERCLEVVGVLAGELPELADVPDLRPLTSEPLNGLATGLAGRLREFRDIASRRRAGWDAGLPVGIGSAIDVENDAVFAEVLGIAQKLRRALEKDMEARRERSRFMLLAVVLGWSALIAAASAALWNRERHRRRAEEELRASREQLLQSQKLDAVGRIAGGLAHDINNYLAAIRGHCELVRMKSPEESRVTRKMDAAIRTVVKASSLIDRLLTFGHAQPVQLEVIDLNRLVEGFEKVLRPTVGERVRLVKRLAPDLGHVEADRSQIEQVFLNLIMNARDAMPDGGEIVLETSNAADGRVTFAVSDTGHGVPAEAHDKIFEPFWTTKDGTNNSGLGLATVYGIVQQAGGSIEVESEVGRGAKFQVTLPRSDKQLWDPDETVAGTAEDLGGTERILVVDDNPDFLESTRALLEALGYGVVTASSGEEALGIFERAADSVDLVLTDVVMPGLSGRELGSRLREIRGDVRVMFMSGYNEDVVLRHGVEEGEVRFLKKQFSSTRLARQIRDVLSR